MRSANSGPCVVCGSRKRAPFTVDAVGAVYCATCAAVSGASAPECETCAAPLGPVETALASKLCGPCVQARDLERCAPLYDGAPSRRVNVLCGCGWGRLAVREDSIPSACPVCGRSIPFES